MKGLQSGRVGVVIRPRVLLVLLIIAAVAFAGFVASLCLGQYPVAAGRVLSALIGDGDRGANLIVLEPRMPRALTGVLVGAAFGLAGALFQAVTRNPLASPDLVGVSAGSGSYAAAPAGAFAGALTAAAVIYVMVYRGGTVTGYRFVLVGIGVHGALTALTGWLLTRADIDQAARAMVWLTGSLNGRGFEHADWMLAALAVTVPLVVALTRHYQLLQYGDDTARGLACPSAAPGSGCCWPESR